MEIRIQFERLDPPAGRVRSVGLACGGPGGESWREFTGWLGLLRILDQLTRRRCEAPRSE